ncbi:MAG TPA: glycoside hydrolase family 2 TIM barrel-domain containing protein [Prolixibacteraceae bacterium]|nr:glycoside hydrolase family 2 TIM barrel-domain containing protein [Prolixibacteraceae bacterium]
MKDLTQRITLISFFAYLLLLTSCQKPVKPEEKLLSDNWTIISSKKVNLDGAVLSSSNEFDQSGWVKTKVPTTVMGALTEAGVIKDPFFGKNLENIPKTDFQDPWWFRTTFDLEDFSSENEVARLILDGINYRANIWLNGSQVASQDSLYGAFRQFDFNVSKYAKAKGNILAIEIFPPKTRDFYMGFVDWAPTPPDNYMGIFREVHIKRTGMVSMDQVFVAPDVDLSDLKSATLKVSTVVTNYSTETKEVEVSGKIENITFASNFPVKPGEKKPVVFDLKVDKPRLWWPNGLGKAEMYEVDMQLKDGSQLADHHSTPFGIRKIETYLTKDTVRGYKVNGREVLIKSGGWVDDLFLRYMPEKDAAQIRMVKEMNMNSIRFEGVWGNNHHIYDLCDKNGILMMVGWSCQWEWPDYLGLELKVNPDDAGLSIAAGLELNGVKLSPKEEDLLALYLKDQVIWLRNHPSILTWATGSDDYPKTGHEAKYIEVLRQYDTTRPLLISSGNFKSQISGPSGMKMNGPYEYVPPVYWYEDKQYGGAFGFNSETGPGPQIPPIWAVKQMMPAEKLWPPMNDHWDWHSGRKDFNSVKVYLTALNNRYGEPKSLEELTLKAQLMNYEAIRPMFEAFVVNKPVTTGVVQWMLNSPWPEFYWQLYDYSLMPTGALYGTKKACAPLNLIYNYFDKKVYVSNDAVGQLENHEAVITVYNLQSEKIFEKSVKVSTAENKTELVSELPLLKGDREVYFLDLKLKNAAGEIVADNFYWLATQTDQMAWDKTLWFYTPQKAYADFTKINGMIPVNPEVSKVETVEGEEGVVTLTLKNPAKAISFFTEIVLEKKAAGAPVLPQFLSDNYISLLPGETKTVVIRYHLKDLNGDQPVIKVQGINLPGKIEL